MTRRPQQKPDEHPHPHIDIPMRLFRDPMFCDNYALLGEFVHVWCHAVWKKQPTFIGTIGTRPDVVELALELGYLIKTKTGYRLTGPNCDPNWLTNEPKTWTTYAVEAVGVGRVKIGKAIDVGRRLESLQCGSAHSLRVTHLHNGDIEKAMHKQLKAYRVGGEWFDLTEVTISALDSAMTRQA